MSARWFTLAFVTIGAIVPFALSGFALFQLSLAMIYAIAILGLNLLTGINGQFSLGHSSFFALGAYVAAIIVAKHDVSFYWALPAAGSICFAAGFAFGWPAARLEGIYLALATFALAVATPSLIKLSSFAPWTGGTQGLVLPKVSPPFDLPISDDRWLYGLTASVLATAMIVAYCLIRSRTGRAFIAIRDNPLAAQTSGIDIVRYRALAFAISALYAGVAGALAAVAIGFVAPDSFTFAFSIALFVGVAVGGAGSVAGSLAGGAFILFVPNLAAQVSKDLAGAIYGAILVAVIYLMPSGVCGLFRALVTQTAQKPE